ncbi:MAG: outer membrane beta-barrel protein [Winogradskyella sp.]|uniref:outer membrane beta-barrel protein n=1 Tax=Winogradskyella sp. TaxID=1883156 RepID=UPI0017E1701E|nr:outer membrane beta-barrel protein [Winogradskyella sp.]
MKAKTRKLILIIGLLVFSYNSYSQTNTDSIQKKKVDTSMVKMDKKLKFGCGFGLNFVGGTNISISPNLTYNVSNKVAFGFGVQWNYLDLKDIQSTTSYGANTVFQFRPSQKILTLLEFAQLRVSTKSEINDSERNFWDSALFVGAGYNITKKISVGAKYNFLYKEDESIYSSPIIPFVNISF